MSGNKHFLHVSPNPSVRKRPEKPPKKISHHLDASHGISTTSRQSSKTSEANVVTRLSPFVIIFFSLAASYLVSGFNLVEKYARQIGSFRQVGIKTKQYLNPPPSYPMNLTMIIFNGDTLASPLPPSKPAPEFCTIKSMIAKSFMTNYGCSFLLGRWFISWHGFTNISILVFSNMNHETISDWDIIIGDFDFNQIVFWSTWNPPQGGWK